MRYCLPIVATCLAVNSLCGAEPKTHTASFEQGRPAEWKVNVGHWETTAGVLVARELDKEMHAGASRWFVPLRDGTVKLKFQFAGAKGFHVGFDPASGQLAKKGHLYSVVVTPGQAILKKHKDKADEKSKDETLATGSSTRLAEKEWISLELQTVGDRVTARIGDDIKLEVADPSFHVAKPGVVFRVLGGDLKLDDVQVTVLKPAE